MVRARYALGAVEVRSWCSQRCASGSVRFVNFSTGDTVGVSELQRRNCLN